MLRVRTTLKTHEDAKRIGSKLILEGLVASVHIRNIESIIQNKGKVIDSMEYELECLTMHSLPVVDKIKELHLYNTPEIIIDMVDTTTDFAQWCEKRCWGEGTDYEESRSRRDDTDGES